MRKLILLLLILLILSLSGCKSETYISVDATYIEYEKRVTKVLGFPTVDYYVTLHYANEEYICEWGNNPSHNERGDVLEVVIEFCEVQDE